MHQAASEGARVAHLTECALIAPGKRELSANAQEITESDWTRLDWAGLERELGSIADAARALHMWTVVGAPCRDVAHARPANSLFVFSDTGDLVCRYDKRYLSRTEQLYMYRPGRVATVFEVDGARFGCAI